MVDFLTTHCAELCDNGKRLSVSDNLAKVSIVGVGMRSHAGVAQRMFNLLATEGINIIMRSPRRRSGSRWSSVLGTP